MGHPKSGASGPALNYLTPAEEEYHYLDTTNQMGCNFYIPFSP